MELLNNLALGFSVASSMQNMLWCLFGVFIGTIVGMLPGVGPLSAIAILLPLAYTLGDPATGIIFLAGIYYGTQYGGSTTSILLNMPGEAASVVTTIDGYQMTRRGRGGAALAIAALGSFVAGTLATVLVALVGEPLAKVAYIFGPTEFTALMTLGLVSTVALSNGSFLKGLGVVIIGFLLGMVGADVNSGVVRFDFGISELYDGLPFPILAMGVFGLSEILYSIFHDKTPKKVEIPTISDLYPTREEIRKSTGPILRGTALGAFLGLIPGSGGIVSSFASYAVEKKISKTPEEFGKGAIEGVAGPESANNASAQTGFIPMLSLGIPTTSSLSLMMAALMSFNIQPGPMAISSNPALFWGLIVSMWIGNVMLLILNYPMVGLWIRLLQIPRWVLFPIVIVFCVAGTYYINNQWFSVLLLIPFAMIGYILKVLECEPAPIAMGFVVGALFEEYLKRALSISDGSWMVFFNSTISLSLLSLTALLTSYGIYAKLRKN
jgi:TctA family transporter